VAGSRLEMDALKRVVDSHKIAILTPFEVPNALVFSLDDYNLARGVGEYLLSLGHRRIGYLEGSWPIGARPRYEGLLSAFTDAGHPEQDIVVAEIDPHDRENIGETTRAAALSLFEKGIDFTALVCYNDAMALGVLQACAEAKVNVPQDLSVVGFDDWPECARTHPSLTTVHFDCAVLGTAMMTNLLDLIEGKTDEQRREIFPGHLVVRDSTAAPRNQT
jgi:LacI family transcriptional regulator